MVEFTKGQRTAEKRDTRRYNFTKSPLLKGKEDEPKKKKNLLEVGGEPGSCVCVEAGRGASRSRNKSIVKVYTGRSQGSTHIFRQGLWVGGDLQERMGVNVSFVTFLEMTVISSSPHTSSS